jgi:hypothetical protein
MAPVVRDPFDETSTMGSMGSCTPLATTPETPDVPDRPDAPDVPEARSELEKSGAGVDEKGIPSR